MACILHDTYDGDAPGYRPVTARYDINQWPRAFLFQPQM